MNHERKQELRALVEEPEKWSPVGLASIIIELLDALEAHEVEPDADVFDMIDAVRTKPLNGEMIALVMSALLHSIMRLERGVTTTQALARVTADNVQLTRQVTDLQERASSLMLELQDARAKLRSQDP